MKLGAWETLPQAALLKDSEAPFALINYASSDRGRQGQGIQ